MLRSKEFATIIGDDAALCVIIKIGHKNANDLGTWLTIIKNPQDSGLTSKL